MICRRRVEAAALRPGSLPSSGIKCHAVGCRTYYQAKAGPPRAADQRRHDGSTSSGDRAPRGRRPRSRASASRVPRTPTSSSAGRALRATVKAPPRSSTSAVDRAMRRSSSPPTERTSSCGPHESTGSRSDNLMQFCEEDGIGSVDGRVLWRWHIGGGPTGFLVHGSMILHHLEPFEVVRPHAAGRDPAGRHGRLLRATRQPHDGVVPAPRSSSEDVGAEHGDDDEFPAPARRCRWSRSSGRRFTVEQSFPELLYFELAALVPTCSKARALGPRRRRSTRDAHRFEPIRRYSYRQELRLSLAPPYANRRMWTLRTRPMATNVVIVERAAVGHERQRDAGDRHDAHRHADVLEDLEHEHGQHADADERAEVVAGQLGRPPDPPDDDREQREQRRRPTKPSSSPTAVKMKSVCCSGTLPSRVCGPSNSPLPVSRRSRWRSSTARGCTPPARRTVELGAWSWSTNVGEPVLLVVLEQARRAARSDRHRRPRRAPSSTS